MADPARLTASRGGNRAAAIRLINRITNIVADGATTRAQKIHELQKKIVSLEDKITTIEDIDKAIQEELEPEDVEAEIEAADTHNQTLRDARDGFTFQLKTLQDAEDAANATLALATAPVVPAAPATPGPSANNAGNFRRHLRKCHPRPQEALRQFKSHQEYLTSLRERHNVSNKRFESTVKIGDVVLVHNEGPRLEWKLAVIEKLIIIPDGEVRATKIRTAGGKTNRPISKLYPLEVTETIEISSPPSQSASSVPVPATRPKRKAAIAANERIRNMAEE
ncbi:hypothetical protein DAPPUDRAFT_113063 [Daphnia pulex]|uniref:DUF5641 domain-containing protein n=1 Tax=Daphnia pulex TaxID=6669 RepID=E9HDZ7_DAPPU|nr:hypothetical protein DAPPUDRAFT_113063 [Daphnia pulex]|eukprot:EFX70010.1 hypothetical protein DAPPUDRAFT_113063 [Daphnia pulex]